MITPLVLRSLEAFTLTYFYIWNRPIWYNLKKRKFIANSGRKLWACGVVNFLLLPAVGLFPCFSIAIAVHQGIRNLSMVEHMCWTTVLVVGMFVFGSEVMLWMFNTPFAAALNRIQRLERDLSLQLSVSKKSKITKQSCAYSTH